MGAFVGVELGTSKASVVQLQADGAAELRRELGQCAGPADLKELFSAVRRLGPRGTQRPNDLVVAVPPGLSLAGRAEVKQAVRAANALSLDASTLRLGGLVQVNLATLAGSHFAPGPGLPAEPGAVLCVDVGDGSCNVSAAQVRPERVAVLASETLAGQGGQGFASRLGRAVLQAYVERARLAPGECRPGPQARARLDREAARAFRELSGIDHARVQVPFLLGLREHDVPLDEPVTRAQLERLIAPDVAAIYRAVDRVLERAGVAFDEVGAVLLVGGASRVPLVRRGLEYLFGARAIVEPRDLFLAARGAARIAAHRLEPVLARSLGVRTAFGLHDALFLDGTPLTSPRRERLELECIDRTSSHGRLVLVEEQRGGWRERDVLSVPFQFRGAGRVVVELELADMLLRVEGRGPVAGRHELVLPELPVGLEARP